MGKTDLFYFPRQPGNSEAVGGLGGFCMVLRRHLAFAPATNCTEILSSRSEGHFRHSSPRRLEFAALIRSTSASVIGKQSVTCYGVIPAPTAVVH